MKPHNFSTGATKTMEIPPEILDDADELIVERRKAEATSAVLAAIVESSDDAIISKNLSGIIRTWNQGAERILGYTSEEAIGQPISFLIPQDRQDEEKDILTRIRRGERINHYETIRRRKDGSLVDVSLSISPIKNSKGKIIGASKIMRDITERKRVELELAQKANDLSRSNKNLEEFTHIVSHDLQSPLRKINLYAELLEKESKSTLGEKEGSYLRNIQKCARKMSQLISTLLRFSKITSANYKPVPVIMNALVNDTVQELELPIKETSAKVSVGNLPTLKANPTQMNQLMVNLIGNALKYCGDKAPIIDISSNKEGSLWVFRVQDNGIGIDAHDTERIFELFHRLNPEEKSGTGIGLTICKRLSKTMEDVSGLSPNPAMDPHFFSRFLPQLKAPLLF